MFWKRCVPNAEHSKKKPYDLITVVDDCYCLVFFFYQGFLSQPFTNHKTAGEGGGHLFNSSVPLPLASQILRH